MTEPILRMTGISKSFHGVPALTDVSLDVLPGEVHAICGENGAGKSTLMKILSGVYPTGSFDGGIELAGEQVDFRSINDSEAAGIVIIHQELALSPYLSIAENIFLGNEVATRGVVDWIETNRRAAALLERVGLDESPATKIFELGVGKQQLVEIAKALSKQVRLLILDEPTEGIQPSIVAEIGNVIRRLNHELGLTVLVVEQKLPFVRRFCDSFRIMDKGRIVASGDMNQLTDALVKTYLTV